MVKRNGKWGSGTNVEENYTCAIDAMQYVPLECLAQVEVRGGHIDQDDKQCWREMKITQAWEWTKKDSVALSVYAAELVIENFETKYPADKRPRQAIEAAKYAGSKSADHDELDYGL